MAWDVDGSWEQAPLSALPTLDSAGPARRWRRGALAPVAVVEVDIPLGQDLDLHDARFLLTYWHLYCQHLADSQSRSYVFAADIPRWARDLFSATGFRWTTARVMECQRSLLLNLEVEADVAEPSAPSATASPRQEKPAKWGRCTLPSCSRRAFRPIMGSRGPFLVCGRRQCQGKRDLTEQE